MSISLFLHQIKLFLKNPIKLGLGLVIPFVLTWSLTQFFEKTQEGLAIPIAIVDQDKSDTSQLVIERLKGLEEVQVFKMESDEAERKLLQGKVDSIFIITEGFEEQLEQEKREETILVKKSSSSFAYGIVQELLSSEVTRISSNMKAANSVIDYYRSLKFDFNAEEVWNKAYAHSDSYWDPEPLMGIDYELHNVSGESVKVEETPYTSNFWSIWAFIVLLMSFISFQWVLRMKDQGLLARMNTTLGGPRAYVFGVGGAHLLLQIVQAAVTVILYFIFVKPEWQIAGAVVWLVLIAYFIGLLLASASKNKGAYYVTAFFLASLFALIGESFFPISDLYEPLEKIKMLSPVTSFMEGTHGQLWNTSSIVWTFAAVLIGLMAIRKSGGRID